MVSVSCISDPMYGAGAGLSTYSGRVIAWGTGRRGDTVPATMGVTSTECSFSSVDGIRQDCRHGSKRLEEEATDGRQILLLSEAPCGRGEEGMRGISTARS